MKREVFEEQVRRLEEVNGIIGTLEPTIQAAAFAVLAPYVTARDAAKPALSTADETQDADATDVQDFETFLATHGKPDLRPADNAVLITAHLYSLYGTEPFSTDEVRQIADDGGLTVPDRVDMTLRQMKRDGKNLFTSATGGFKPTVAGETYLKTTYQVKKGRGKRAAAADQP